MMYIALLVISTLQHSEQPGAMSEVLTTGGMSIHHCSSEVSKKAVVMAAGIHIKCLHIMQNQHKPGLHLYSFFC